MADCKTGSRYGKGLFIESEECTDDHLNTFEQEAVYDAEEEEEYVSRVSIPYRRLYRFSQWYDIFRIPVNTGIPFRDYR